MWLYADTPLSSLGVRVSKHNTTREKPLEFDSVGKEFLSTTRVLFTVSECVRSLPVPHLDYNTTPNSNLISQGFEETIEIMQLFCIHKPLIKCFLFPWKYYPIAPCSLINRSQENVPNTEVGCVSCSLWGEKLGCHYLSHCVTVSFGE